MKVPPAAVALGMAALQWYIARAVPVLDFVLPVPGYIAIVLGVAGAVVALLGVGTFVRAGTTVNPLTPDASSSLVTGGVYTISRNPMYLGFLLLLLAWGIYLSSAAALLIVVVFVGLMNRFQIAPEESALHARYGADFAAYCRQVRRWI